MSRRETSSEFMRSRSAASRAFSQPCSMWMRLHRPCSPSRPCLASQGRSLPSVLTFSCSALSASIRADRSACLCAFAVDGLLPAAAVFVQLRHLLLQLVQARVRGFGGFLRRRPIAPAGWSGALRRAPRARCGRLPGARGAGSAGATAPRCCAGRRPAPGSAAAPGPRRRAARWTWPAPGAAPLPDRAAAAPVLRPGRPAASAFSSASTPCAARFSISAARHRPCARPIGRSVPSAGPAAARRAGGLRPRSGSRLRAGPPRRWLRTACPGPG